MRIWIKILFVILIVLVVAGTLLAGVSNLSYFDVREIKLEHNGVTDAVPQDVINVLAKTRGVNIFRLNMNTLRQELLECEGVLEAKVSRYFPDCLMVRVYFNRFVIKVRAGDYFYCADSERMIQVSEERYNMQTDLNEVFLPEGYAGFITKWGYDEGFVQMLELASQISPKFLITGIKYDNNNSNRFGRMILELSSLNVELYVREPVTWQRLEEALGCIGEEGRYDLYANALVKRTQGGVKSGI